MQFSKRVYLPVILWFVLSSLIFLLALFQGSFLPTFVPFLHPASATAALHFALLSYLVFVWPLSLPYVRSRSQNRRHGRIRFLLAALSGPGVLFLALAPLFGVAGFFSQHSLGHALCVGAAWLPLAAAILAYFHLAFYFRARLLKMYVPAAVGLCVGLPALDFLLSFSFGRGAGALADLNPFRFLGTVLATPAPLEAPLTWAFALALGSVALFFTSLPLALGRLPRDAYHHLSFSQNEAQSP
jgi:hypothetical protein